MMPTQPVGREYVFEKPKICLERDRWFRSLSFGELHNIFVQSANCMCGNFQIYLRKFQKVFVQNILREMGPRKICWEAAVDRLLPCHLSAEFIPLTISSHFGKSFQSQSNPDLVASVQFCVRNTIAFLLLLLLNVRDSTSFPKFWIYMKDNSDPVNLIFKM